MISATVAAWALSGVDRCSMSCPEALRFSEALNVAKRTTGGGPWVSGVVAAMLGDTTPRAVAPVAHSNATSIRRIGRARITSTSEECRLEQRRYQRLWTRGRGSTSRTVEHGSAAGLADGVRDRVGPP